jgi:CBS domain-containing protein
MLTRHRIHCVVVAGLQRADERGATWGVVSDLDLVRAAGTGEDLSAGETAATEVVTAAAADTLAEAARLMAEHDIAHLLVVDDRRGQPIGVISTLDVAEALAGEAS